MKQRTANNLTALISGALGFLCLLMLIDEAGATSYKNPKAEASAQAEATSQAAAQAESNQTVNVNLGESGPLVQDAETTTLTTGDTSVDLGDSNVENNSSNVVLVPNNNTESCLRVFGIAFGKDGSAGSIGFPWRSAPCDYEQAADDAFAAGERDLGWFWKCQNKNLYKRFRNEGESPEKAIEDCHTRMLATTSTDEVVEKLEQRLRAAEELIDLQERHKKVCDESLERCKDYAYGEK